MGIRQLPDPDVTQHLAGAFSLHPAEPSDETLLLALARGADWELEPLYNRYSGLLYSLAFRMVDDHQVAEELVQDTFVAVWQHAASYSPQAGPVRGWLISLLRHRAIDHLRKVRRRSCWKEVPWEEADWEEDVALPDVCEDAWRSEQREQVREAVSHLPTKQRLVIALAYFLGWTHTEIAQRCRLPLGTVKACMRLALLHLKQALVQSGLGEMFPSIDTKRGKVRPGQAEVVIQATENGCASGYELCRDGSCSCFGYIEWEHLVEEVETFEFSGAVGSFTARKERRLHGRAYWYAFTCGSANRRKVYLGRSAELSLARLEDMASKLHL